VTHPPWNIGAGGPGGDDGEGLRVIHHRRPGTGAAGGDQYAALLPVCERVLGPEHPETLNVRSHLAFWTGQAADGGSA